MNDTAVDALIYRSMTSHFNVINKFGQKVSKEGGVDYKKQTDSVKNPYKKNEETGTLGNEINCGSIGTCANVWYN